jgi:hypothetical protein
VREQCDNKCNLGFQIFVLIKVSHLQYWNLCSIKERSESFDYRLYDYSPTPKRYSVSKQRSRDLTPLDLLLWKYMKTRLQRNPSTSPCLSHPRRTDNMYLVACDVAYMQVLSSVWSDTEYYFDAYIMTSGAHIESH